MIAALRENIFRAALNILDLSSLSNKASLPIFCIAPSYSFAASSFFLALRVLRSKYFCFTELTFVAAFSAAEFSAAS